MSSLAQVPSEIRKDSAETSAPASSGDAFAVYCLPFRVGNSYLVSQGSYGKTHTGENEHAVDFVMPVGTPIIAARAGVVARVEDKFDQRGQTEELMTQANEIRIRHDDGTYASYAHLDHGGSTVHEGQYVKRGQLIGYSGNTGFTSGPHLHFNVLRLDGNARKSVPVLVDLGEQGAIKLDAGARVTAPPVCSY